MSVARAAESGAPPFEPGKAGIIRHEVFVTGDEAIFVFETEPDVQSLEKILADPELWEVAAAWEHCIAGPPRLAAEAYRWPER